MSVEQKATSPIELPRALCLSNENFTVMRVKRSSARIPVAFIGRPRRSIGPFECERLRLTAFCPAGRGTASFRLGASFFNTRPLEIGLK